jgi:hypothetical protein
MIGTMSHTYFDNFLFREFVSSMAAHYYGIGERWYLLAGNVSPLKISGGFSVFYYNRQWREIFLNWLKHNVINRVCTVKYNFWLSPEIF